MFGKAQPAFGGKNAPKPNPKREVMLGNIAMDVMSGYTGTVQAIVEEFNGNIKYQIQPKSDDGVSFKEPMLFDKACVDFVSEGIADRVTPAPTEVNVKLGDTAKDTVTGHTGAVLEKSTFINGCVHFVLFGQIVDGKIQTYIFNHERLVSTGKAEIGPKVTVPKPKSKTGGPATRMPQRG